MFGIFFPPCPKFKIGDEVSYELSWWGKPRWHGNSDHGGSGHWETGEVVQVEDKLVTVKGRTGISSWPLTGHKNYVSQQWSRAGYLRITKEVSDKKESKCTCGAEAVYGVNAPHSDWCDK